MSAWKSLGKDVERDLREAAESVRGAFAASDPRDIAEGAAEFAQTIVECAVTPIAAFLSGLPRAIDAVAWKRGRPSPASDWDDES